MKKIVFLLLASFCLVYPAHAQFDFKYGVETGMGIATFPNRYQYQGARHTSNRWWYSVPGPIAGVRGQIRLTDYVLFSSGLNFNVISENYRSVSTGEYLTEGGISGQFQSDNFTSEIKENLTVFRVSAPVSVGFTVPICKVVRPSFSIGHKFNYLAGGKFSYRFANEYEGSRENSLSEQEYNPVNPAGGGEAIPRFTNQMFIRLAAEIKDKFQVGVSLNGGRSWIFSEYPLGPWACIVDAYDNVDWGFEFSWWLGGKRWNPLKNKKSHPPVADGIN